MNESRKELPKVTIGMPTFNSGWSLPKVLESILKFDYDSHRLRLVFIDNFSTDNTIAILQEFAAKHSDEFESIVIEKERGNIPTARNICFERSDGTEYVFMLDSDVVAPPDSIRILLHDFDSYDNVALASFPSDQANAKDRARLLYDGFETTKTQAYAYKVGTPCSIVSMEAVRTIGGFNPRLNVHEDGEYCFRLKRHGYNIICDFTREGIHLKRVQHPPRYYFRFIWSSSNTYIELLKLRSPMHVLKVVSSIVLIVSFALLLAFPQLPSLLFFIGSLAFAFWVNANKRVLDDGIYVKRRYFLIIAPILTILTVMVVITCIARAIKRGLNSIFKKQSRAEDPNKSGGLVVKATSSK